MKPLLHIRVAKKESLLRVMRFAVSRTHSHNNKPNMFIIPKHIISSYYGADDDYYTLLLPANETFEASINV